MEATLRQHTARRSAGLGLRARVSDDENERWFSGVALITITEENGPNAEKQQGNGQRAAGDIQPVARDAFCCRGWRCLRGDAICCGDRSCFLRGR